MKTPNTSQLPSSLGKLFLVCASITTGCGGDFQDAPLEGAVSNTGTVEQASVYPRSVAQALSERDARLTRIASYWNKSCVEFGLGTFKADNSKRSMRRIAAGFLSLDRPQITPRAPGNFPALVTEWTKGANRFAQEGTAGITGEGDYDMDEREITALLYTFKDRPDLLTNEAAFNLIMNGTYFWHGSSTTHAMQFEVGPVNWYSETENHVLMTLASQYLMNQWIYKNSRNDARLKSAATIESYVPRIMDHNGHPTTTPIARIPNLDFFKSSTDLENTILAAIGRIPHAGYFETNARNYNAISQQTLFNLYAFADSAKIRAAAKNALDYSAAKFAFQSLDCKRFSPHRRHYETTEKPGIWENDSTMFLWGAISGACEFPDSFDPSGPSTDLDTNFYTYGDQGKGFALWALMQSDARLVGARRYTIPEPIHDFMLNKHNGLWARFQDRFTQNHYRLWNNPRYFYDDGQPYLSGDFVQAPEFNFVTNEFMNVAGGNHATYELAGDGKKWFGARIYDFWARPSAVIPAGHYKFQNVERVAFDDGVRDWVHTGDWGYSPDVRRKLMNHDILNMSSGGDEWWYGSNIGVFKNFTFGSDPANVPRDPRFPLYSENGQTEFVNEFGTLKFRFQQSFIAGADYVGYYLVLGETLDVKRSDGKPYYFWEVLPSHRFNDTRALKSMVLSRNYGAGELRNGTIDIALSNGDIITVTPRSEYPITRVYSQGKELPLNRFWYDTQFPRANPLMEVFEVDRDFNFTGVRYAENPKSGVINIWNPFVGKGLVIDSSDYKNPKTSDTTSSPVSTRPDLVTTVMPAAGNWGDWYGPKYCPAGQFAVSYRMRVEPNQGSNDDTSLNAIQLECKPVTSGAGTWISPHDGYWGNWTGAATCSNANPTALNNFLTAAQLQVESSQGSGDDTGANNAIFKCGVTGTMASPGGRNIGTWSSFATCPAGTAVCGFSSRIEGPQGGEDDTAMNGLSLECCKLPTSMPACTSPINEQWTDSLGSAGSGWTKAWGDPYVDTANRRLVLSFDDIVDRVQPFAGSYYVSHQVTLSGGTAFTPYVYVDQAMLPSIRRSGNDMQFGGDGYGYSWSDTDPLGFAGKRASNVLTGKVTTYLKAQAKQIAMKVEAGGSVYRSGWTTMTWPQTNVGIYRLVGENNGQVYSGTDDYVYVGPLSGCSNMSDASVDSTYNQ